MTNRGGIDDLDRQLIAELLSDPRASLTALGKQIGVSGTTVATRLERLREEGFLRIEVRPNLAAFGIARAILGMIETETPRPAAVQAILANSPYVLRIDELTGEFSLAFLAVFPSDEGLGGFLRQIQGSSGVRRLVVHHVMDTVKETTGWEVVLTDLEGETPAPYEIAPGVHVPAHLALSVQTAASWMAALVDGDKRRVEALSSPDIVFQVVRPRALARIHRGLDEVMQATAVAPETYSQFCYRIVNVLDAQPPYTVVLDALSPTESANGKQFTAFSRIAYEVTGGKVRRATSIGQIDLDELPDAAEPERLPR